MTMAGTATPRPQTRTPFVNDMNGVTGEGRTNIGGMPLLAVDDDIMEIEGEGAASCLM